MQHYLPNLEPHFPGPLWTQVSNQGPSLYDAQTLPKSFALNKWDNDWNENKLLFVNAQHFNRHPTLINPFNSKNNPRGARYYCSILQTKKLRFSDIEGPSPEQCDCRVSTLFPALAENTMEHTVGGSGFTMPGVCEQGLGDPLADGMGCVEKGDRGKHYNFFSCWGFSTLSQTLCLFLESCPG